MARTGPRGRRRRRVLPGATHRLEELRLAATEERVDADLRLGRGAELVTELTTLVAEHPLRERLVGALMRALSQAGRPAEALTVYERTRQTLADQLGADPSPELSTVHTAVLRGQIDLRPRWSSKRLRGPDGLRLLPRDAAATVASADGGRFALPGARCDSRSNARYGPAADVTVELRGAGPASRQVNAICMPETFPAQRLLVCEVLTPAGNWSPYPPHKHDDERAGESVLEEIYYFQIRREAGVRGEGGVGFQRVYGPGIDVLAEVRDGDVVLVPHGWHGPSMAVPGYDMYYLNVMAGPSPQRSWTISLDPDHAWIRDGWAGQRMDPRLPMTGGSQP